MKILANDGLSLEGVDILVNNGFDVITENIPQDQLVKYLNDNHIDAIIVRSATQVRQELIEEVPSLKLIARAGVGMDNIDADFAKEMGLHVIKAADASSRAVAELVFGHMLSIARFLHDSNRSMPLEGDQNFLGLKDYYRNAIELNGKTLGIIGLGAIGMEVARIAIGMGMNVIGSDSSYDENTKELELSFPNGQKLQYNIDVKPMEEVLKLSDFVTLHLPNQDKYVLTENELEMMKDGAYLINTSRGGLVDEVALVQALEVGKLSGAALDVFENEPNPEIQLLMHPKLSLSPHVGGATVEAQNRIGVEIANQISELFYKDLY